jgi:putative sensory transduction regulator
VIRRPSERRYAGAMAATETDAAAAVEAYLETLEGETRRVAAGEWGLTVDAAGWPLHVGVALRDGLLRAQAEVIQPGRLDDHVLLHWNRSLPLVRFSHTGEGAVWVQGDLPVETVTIDRLDGFLGLLVRVATQAREAAVG